MTSYSSPKHTHLFLVVFSFFLISCGDFNEDKYENNVIASAHPLATNAGEAMFEQGGTAADAAVAAGFALAVVEPSMSGIGGRLQALYRGHDGKLAGIDASTEVPINYVASKERYKYGYETIGIPGVVAGLLALHQAEGQLPLSTVMAPAIQLAKEGFLLLPGEAFRQQMALKQLVEFEGTKKYFTKNDSIAYQTGDLLIQKDLAMTLERIAAEGHKGFYEGETAQRMVTDIQANGGILTLEDLKNYKALPSKVVRGRYRGHDIHALYLPSFGAITIQILQLLDQLTPLEKGDAAWATTVGKLTKMAYDYRQYQTNQDSLRSILSSNTAHRMAAQFEADYVMASNNSTSWPEAWKVAMGHTTHLTAADAEGRIVSLTQTIGPNMGSKVASPGLGFLYAVTLGGYLGDYQPGDRAISHISPTFISSNDQVVLALGAAGGSRIVTAVTQVVQRYIDQKMSLEKALAAPRVYPDKDTLLLENHSGIVWPETITSDLTINGYPFKFIEDPARFGRVHAVALDSLNNRWIGAADPDWEGTVSGDKQ